MATRIGGDPTPGIMMPPGGDNRLEQRREQMIKELRDREVVRTRGEAEHVVDQVLRRLQPDGGGLKVAPLNPDGTRPGEKRPDDRPRTDGKRDNDARSDNRTDNRADNRPDNRADNRIDARGDNRVPDRPRADAGRAQEPTRAVADFQRENGLPVTGKLDAGTLQALKDKGLVTTGPKPEAPAPQKAPVSAQDQVGARKLFLGEEKDKKVRAEQHEPNKPVAKDTPRDLPRADAVTDPARLLASLVTAGFLAKKGALEDGLKSFQATFSLPITGKLDKETLEALKKQNLVEHSDHIEHDTPPATQKPPPEKPQNVKRALNDAHPTAAADKTVERDTTRAQAQTKQPTTTNDVAARAPSTSDSAAADTMRLDSVLAQQVATERGVQEGKGDPHAVKGQGASEGQGAGVQGKGGESGGGQGVSGQGALAPAEGPEGEESAVGNSKAGDDNFLDEARGQASTSLTDGVVEDGSEGHYQVPPLSEQVQFALLAIRRDDDGSGPVTYSWDVTFYRPGIYAPGQPAEEIWRVVVSKATAFDPVWQTASDAITSKMLYMEPDSDPPTLDDFVAALKRARVAD